MNRAVNFAMVAVLLLAGALFMSIFLKFFPDTFYRDKPHGLCEANLPDKPNWVSSVVSIEDPHYIAPLPMTNFYQLAEAIDAIDPKTYKIIYPYYIEGYRRTNFFGFTDWFCITDTGQITSTATLGHSDLGVNRRWVESLRSKLQSGSNPS